MDARQSFKAAFLMKCAEAGMTLEETVEAAEKAAWRVKRAGVLDAVKSVGQGIMSYGVPVATLAPPLLGGAVGYGLAKMTDTDHTDIEAMKRKELIENYETETKRLLREQAVRALARAKPAAGRRALL